MNSEVDRNLAKKWRILVYYLVLGVFCLCKKKSEESITTRPFVDMASLRALGKLLADLLKARPASSKVPLSGASWASREQNRGEAHAREDSIKPGGGTAEPDQVRSAAQARADGSVRKRPVQRRDRFAGVAGTAGGDAACADQADGAAASGACGQERGGCHDAVRS